MNSHPTFVQRAAVTGLLLLSLLSGSASGQVETFDSGMDIVTGGYAFNRIEWSGNAGENRVPLSGAAWEASPFYDNGFLNGPDGLPSDAYIWLYDTRANRTDWFEATALFPATREDFMSYDLIDAYRNAGQTHGITPSNPKVGITNGTLFLFVNVFTSTAESGTIWHNVTASYDIGQTAWRVGTSAGGFTSTYATQAQVDSIISGTGWRLIFGMESINGGTGTNGPEFMAVDNLIFVPEPSTLSLVPLGLLAILRRRRIRPGSYRA